MSVAEPLPGASRGTGLRLHLGCGNDHWPGWINIDRQPGPAVDLVSDIRELSTHFAPGSCASIHLMHAINYLTLWEARDFFRTARALLGPGGDLVIETADAAAAARRFLDAMGGDFDSYLEGIRAFPGFGLDHLEQRERYTPNSMAWTPWHLGGELLAAGFAHVQQTEPRTHAKWRDCRVEAYVDAPGAGVAASSGGPRVHSVLFVVDEEAGHVTAHLRARLFVDPLRRRGITATVMDARRDTADAIASAARTADLVYVVKVPSLALVRHIKAAARGPVVYDFTDALWLPHHAAYGWQDLHTLLAEADAITCDNEVIAAYARQHNTRVHLWPASTQVELLDAARQRIGVPIRTNVRIGWVGSRGTAGAITALEPVLRAFAAQVPHAELRLLGCDETVLPDIDGLLVTARPQYDEAAMIDELVQLDIGLFPAPQSLEDYRNRGPLKGVLYMSTALPMIAQRGGELDGIVQQGVNGFTADTPEEWTSLLVQLASDRALRQRVGAAARASVADRTREAITDRLVAIFQTELEHSPPAHTPNTATHDVPGLLDALQQAVTRGDLDEARAVAASLVEADPGNADFRAVLSQLGG